MCKALYIKNIIGKTTDYISKSKLPKINGIICQSIWYNRNFSLLKVTDLSNKEHTFHVKVLPAIFYKLFGYQNINGHARYVSKIEICFSIQQFSNWLIKIPHTVDDYESMFFYYKSVGHMRPSTEEKSIGTNAIGVMDCAYGRTLLQIFEKSFEI